MPVSINIIRAFVFSGGVITVMCVLITSALVCDQIRLIGHFTVSGCAFVSCNCMPPDKIHAFISPVCIHVCSISLHIDKCYNSLTLLKCQQGEN